MIPAARQQTWRPDALDARIGLCVVICCLASNILTAFGLRFPVGEMRLEIIQKMTACISCLLCCQDGLEASRRASLTRVLVTVVGGVAGVLVVALDQLLGSNVWLLVPLLGMGLVATMCACRLVGAPAFNARIGGITFLLVVCTLTGTARIWYAVFRLVSTVFGALVVSLVTTLMTGSPDDR